MAENMPRIVYAGDRNISVSILKYLLQEGIEPLALMVSGSSTATHAEDLIRLCKHIDNSLILKGNDFKLEEGVRLLKDIRPDFILSIHYPYIYTDDVLKIPVHGVVNLHPAYLPYNRGWHTPSWAIYDNTPYGATLHFMNEEIDMGDIIARKEIKVLPDDTADSLYKRVKQLEVDIFKESWPSLADGTYSRTPQSGGEGTVHKKNDLLSIQHIEPEKSFKAIDLIRRLRALSTSDIYEALWYELDGKRYRIQVNISEDRS